MPPRGGELSPDRERPWRWPLSAPCATAGPYCLHLRDSVVLIMGAVNFKEHLAGIIGACASCANVRSFILNRHGEEEFVPYNGDKHARCAKFTGTHIVMREMPSENDPLNECWEMARKNTI